MSLVQTRGIATLFAQLAINFAQLSLRSSEEHLSLSAAVLAMFGAPQNTSYSFGASSANPSPAMGIQIDDLVDSAGEQQNRDAQLAAAGYDAAFAQRSGLARQGAAGQPGTVALTGDHQKIRF